MSDFYEKMEQYRIQREENLPKLIAILKELGIEMNVVACGCCESPWISAWYKGEQIVDNADSASFKMRETKGEE